MNSGVTFSAFRCRNRTLALLTVSTPQWLFAGIPMISPGLSAMTVATTGYIYRARGLAGQKSRCMGTGSCAEAPSPENGEEEGLTEATGSAETGKNGG